MVIDACMIGAHCSLLQQACNLTGGIYTKPARLSALLQYLLVGWHAYSATCNSDADFRVYSRFIPLLQAVHACNTQARASLVLPQTHGVDFRASCFCHKACFPPGRHWTHPADIACHGSEDWVQLLWVLCRRPLTWASCAPSACPFSVRWRTCAWNSALIHTLEPLKCSPQR